VYLGGIWSLNSLLFNPEDWLLALYDTEAQDQSMGTKVNRKKRYKVMCFQLFWALIAAFTAS